MRTENTLAKKLVITKAYEKQLPLRKCLLYVDRELK